MTKNKLMILLVTLIAIPVVALGVVEEKTGVEYPNEITISAADQDLVLKVTGVGLREKTFMKIDVYTIVSYVAADAVLEGDDVGLTLCALQQPKRLQMDLRRGFSRDNLINAFVDVIEKNYEDTSAFADDMEGFKGYFTRDAQEGDMILFDYCPQKGLVTTLNGEEKGTIANAAFAEALWSVWFGEKPANDGLKKNMLAALGD